MCFLPTNRPFIHPFACLSDEWHSSTHSPVICLAFWTNFLDIFELFVGSQNDYSPRNLFRISFLTTQFIFINFPLLAANERMSCSLAQTDRQTDRPTAIHVNEVFVQRSGEQRSRSKAYNNHFKFSVLVEASVVDAAAATAVGWGFHSFCCHSYWWWCLPLPSCCCSSGVFLMPLVVSEFS